MKIGLIGAGRLGICLAILIEEAGYEVLVSDIRDSYVKDLQNNKITTNEPEVQFLLKNQENLRATTNNLEVIRECDIIYTLVATPSNKDGSYNVDSVWKVVEDFKKVDVTGKSLVIGCTTNPGDCIQFQESLSDYGVDVFYNPEFIAQGSIINDLRHADMVLIGGYGHHVSVIEEIYRAIQVTQPEIYTMSLTAAELVKMAVNCYLTTKISFANMVGEVLTLNNMEDEIDNVLNAIGADSRIGTKYLGYGYGFGGPCLPRDNRAWAHAARKVGLKHNLGFTTDEFNEEHAEFLKNYFIKCNPDKSVPFYFEHISYKKGSDILTESQQYRLCKDLLFSGYTVYIKDIPDIIKQVSATFYDQFYDRVIFVDESTTIPSNIFNINLS